MKQKIPMKYTRHAVFHLNALKKGIAILFILLASRTIATAAITCDNNGNSTAENIVYSVNGNTVSSLSGHVSSGDVVKVCFTLSGNGDSTIFSLVSYKAPGSTFDASTAWLQTVFDEDSHVFQGSGTYCLSVKIPYCYFQIDFVKGCVIDQLGPESSNNFYGTQNRLITGLNGGTGTCNCVADADAGPDLVLDCNSTYSKLWGYTSTHHPIILWLAYDGGNIVSGANTLTPEINAAGKYILFVTDTLGCIAKDSVMVTGGTNVLTPGVIGVDQNHCGPFKPAPLTALVDATANPGETITYQWLYSLVNVPNTYGNPYWHVIPGVHTSGYSPDSIFVTTYFIRCARTTECTFVGYTTESNIVTIDILNCCAANADAGDDFTLDCNSTQANLTGSTTTYHPVILWTTTDGHIVSGASTLTPVITLAGTYVLHVFDTIHKCSATDTVIVDGHTNVLTPGVIGTDQNHCGPFKPDMLTALIPATANPGETITYQWLYSLVDTGNTYGNPYWHAIPGANSADYSPDSIFVSTFFIRCSKTVGCTFVGYTTESNIVDIYIYPKPKVNLGNDTVVCAYQCVPLDAGNPGAAYYWSTGATTRTINACSTGTYAVTVTDNYGCTATDAIHVTVSPKVKVDLGNDTTVVFCVGSLTLDADNSGSTYTWSTGATSQTIGVSSTGGYTVTVTNSYGCTGTDAINVTVNPDNFSFNLGNDTTIVLCHHDSLLIGIEMLNATYSWSNGATSATIVVKTGGKFYLTITDSLGCTASDSINITIIDKTIDLNLGNDTTICGCIVLDATSPDATYQWCSGGTYPSKTVCKTGVYCVEVRNGVCIEQDTISVTVKPAPVVHLGNDTTLIGGSLMLDAGNPGASYHWSTGATTETIMVSVSGTYAVTITDKYGCTASDSIKVNFITGIAENSSAGFPLYVYPNPSNEKKINLSFDVPEKRTVEIRIMDQLGVLVYLEKIENFQGKYNKPIVLEKYSAGIYFVNVRNGNNNGTVKVALE